MRGAREVTRTRLLLALVLTCGYERGPKEQAAPSAPVVEALAPTTLPRRSLRLGRPPTLTADVSKDEYRPLASYLGRVIDHDIIVVTGGSYDEVVDSLVAGKIDLALLTPFLYVRAKKRLPNVRLLARILGEGVAQYRGYIVTAAASPLQKLQDLKGKRFAFVDRASASGYLYPQALLQDAGVDVPGDFKEVIFTGSHPKVVEAILSGTVDAGAISSTTFMHLRGDAISSRLFILAKTDWIPFDAFVAHPNVPEPVAEQIKQSLLGLSTRTPEGRDVLTGVTTTNGFVEGDDASYDSIRRVAKRLSLE